MIYRIESDREFPLYLNLLVPRNTNAQGRYSADIYRLDKERVLLGRLDAGSAPWKDMFEPFGFDWYVQGPELKRVLPAGKYDIEINGSNNQGKYVLAVGEKEYFNLSETINALNLIPKLKWSIFHSASNLFILSPFGIGYIVVIFLLSFIFAWLVRLALRKIVKKWYIRARINIGRTDRWIRGLIGMALFLAAVMTYWSPFLLFFAGFTFYEALASWCGFYALIGKSTCPL